MTASSTRITAVKGTRDFYPEDMAFHNWLRNNIAAVSESFGYQAYDGPVLERIELYAAKSGEELVQQQAFVLEDRGGDKLCLRPELTPTLARMIAQKQRELRFPVRWYSFGAFWRYEQPQRGRTREFYQWNIDLLGSDSIAADAEVIAAGASLLQALGLTPDEVVIKVSSRQWLIARLLAAGIPQAAHLDVLHLIDRYDKLPAPAWLAQARALGLNDGQLSALTAVLTDQDGWRQDPGLTELLRELDHLGVLPFVEFDPRIVRGLDYYTGVVFEAKDRQGRFRSILGGGRYDNLVAAVGGDRVTGVGFAMGDVVIRVVLEETGHLPALVLNPSRVFVTVFSDELRPISSKLAREFRAAGIPAEQSLTGDKLAKQLKRVNQLGIPWAVICGPDEAAAGLLTLRDMTSGGQQQLALADAIALLIKV